MRRLLRDPLFHFLLGGLLLFLAFDVVRRPDPRSETSDVIVVDRAALLQFVQQRTRAFDPRAAARRLDALGEPERRRLIEDYVREEALHREALALGLDRDDYVLRRRLVQKLEFIAEGFAETGSEIEPAELERFFEAHRDDYLVEAHASFTHVFYDAERRGWEGARARARADLARLNAEGALFSEAPRHGDRFPYHVNYVERTPDYVRSHFGAPLAEAIFALEPDEGTWRGPFESPYGAHLVMVVAQEPARAPDLDEVRGRVEQDARHARVRERTEAAIREIVGRYRVVMALGRDELDARAATGAPGS